jgi:cell division protease FtsH
MSKKKKIILLVILLVVAIISGYFVYRNQVQVEIPLSEAIALSKSNIFSEMKIGTNELELMIAEGVKDKTSMDTSGKEIILQEKQKVKTFSSLNLKELKEIGFVAPNVYQSYMDGPNWMVVALNVIPLLFFVFFFIYMSGGLSQFNQFKKDNSSLSFADVGGINNVKASLMEVVGFIKDYSYLDNVGARIPRGILLSGSPGVGKTMLARAMATEAGVPFYYTTGSEFHGMFVGQAANKVKKLFKVAKKTSSIIFIDEFDSIAQTRSFSSSDVSREFDHTLNQMLAEMDGFDKNTKVLVIAATNHPEVLDPAVMRPGRFDRRISVSLPTFVDRCEILEIHRRGKVFSESVDMKNIARQTSGMSGADLAAILNESAIIAGKSHKTEIDITDIHEAMDKIEMGSERKNLLSESTKKLVAYHEAGHALVASMLPDCDKVQRISILPRENAGGFTRLSIKDEESILSRTKALSDISVFFGGRAAEEIVLNDISSGAQNDIMRANALAREMVEHYGMGKTFGLGYYDSRDKHSTENRQSIDRDINLIVSQCYETAKQILMEKRSLLDRIANKLLEVECMDEIEIEEIMRITDQINTKVGVENAVVG